jgi:hypothetical protein
MADEVASHPGPQNQPRQAPIPTEKLNIDKFTGEKARILRELLTNEDFKNSHTFREQCHVADRVTRSKYEDRGRHWVHSITLRDLGIFFGVQEASVANQIKKPVELHHPGRPSVIELHIKVWIEKLVRDRVKDHHPLTFADLEVELFERWDRVIKPDTLRNIVHDQMKNIRVARGIPTEAARVNASDDDIRLWYQELARKLRGVRREFVFNADESGFSEWTDAKEVSVLVPDDYKLPTIPVPVDRKSKRRSMCVCIGADGSTQKPFIIVERVTAEIDVRLIGYTEDKVAISFQKAAFMTKKLFIEWAEEIFFRDVRSRRHRYQYEGRAILLLDGLTCHHSDTFLERCDEEHVEVVPLVPHTSDQTQPLDLLTFALAKQHYRSSPRTEMCSEQSTQIVKMMNAIHAATSVPNNVSAFRRAGLVPYQDTDGHFYLQVDLTKATCLRRLVDQRTEVPRPRDNPREDFGRRGKKRYSVDRARSIDTYEKLRAPARPHEVAGEDASDFEPSPQPAPTSRMPRRSDREDSFDEIFVPPAFVEATLKRGREKLRSGLDDLEPPARFRPQPYLLSDSSDSSDPPPAVSDPSHIYVPDPPRPPPRFAKGGAADPARMILRRPSARRKLKKKSKRRKPKLMGPSK